MLPSATIFVLRRQREVRNFFKQADGANSGNARHIRVSDFGRHEKPLPIIMNFSFIQLHR
jgi:hypothetical protein